MFVYLLRSIRSRERIYVGSSSNVDRRLIEHNAGSCVSTRKHRPWNVDFVCWFSNLQKARKFEEYLKSGSGRAFSKRHF